jgi:hypothetical protein
MNLIALTAALIGAMTLGGSAIAARKTCPDGGYPPCNKPPVGETASNNLSYPVIWADGVVRPDFAPTDTPWRFEGVTWDAVEENYFTDVGQGPVYCVGEDDITPPELVDSKILCYYGRRNLGISEVTGQREFEGDPKAWMLQQRQPFNQWQVFNTVDPVIGTPVVVTGVDTGDLLESSITIKAKQIRTEFTLLKTVSGGAGYEDPKIAGIVADDEFTQFRPEHGCVLNDNVTIAPNNCFAAHSMSGAVPGTDQSIAETQGTDWPFDDQHLLLDPRDVKMAKTYFDPSIPVPAAAPGTEESEPDPRIVPIEPPLGMDATVYTPCARLVIQKLTGDPANLYWDSDAGSLGGSWMPRADVNSPVVDINSWSGSYSAEINAGGSLIYGYNWNTQKSSEGAGAYRLTFVLEGGSVEEGRCGAGVEYLNTVFDDTTLSINVGERRPATVLSKTALAGTRGEGGAVYVDVEIATGGGGGGGGRPR